MKTIYFRQGALAVSIALVIILSGCGLLDAGKPVAVIASPPSGTQVDVNTEVQVQVNSTDNQGIVRIDLLANGTVVATETSPQANGQPTFSAVLRYTPKTPGQQVIEARSYNRKGDSSAPVSINLQVRDAQALATGTPETFPSLTPLAVLTATQTIAPGAPTNAPPPAPVTIVVQPPPPQQPTQPAAPSKPSDFKADGTGTIIAFTWDDKATNELGFRIYQVGVVAPVITLPAHTGTGGMSYNWPGQLCNFTASFYIRAYNNDGESGSSNSDGAITVPCTPTNLTAIAGATAIQFNWAVTSPHNESGFRIYQQGVSGPVASRGPNLGSGGTVFAWSGLHCNLLGTFSVRAYNSAGESSDSNLIQTEDAPCPPSGLTITNITKDKVEYKWTDNGTNETGFHVYRYLGNSGNDVLYVPLPAHPGTGTVSSDAAQFCDVNFAVTYVYSVRAFNAAGESGSSEHVGATTPHC